MRPDKLKLRAGKVDSLLIHGVVVYIVSTVNIINQS